MCTFQQFFEEQNNLDKVQAALDIIGFDPTVGTAADATNTVISSLRAAFSKEPDQQKRHIINAGISAISMIPFADVIKMAKLRKLNSTVTKAAVRGARAVKDYGKTVKSSDRFNSPEEEESRRLDPKCWKGYRKKGTKLKGGVRVNDCVKV
jgi:hypothetical protein